MPRNLYDLLGVRPDDDAEDLRKAFLKAAKESHPDHHGGDPEAATRFRQIAEAYDILRDTEQRAAYDQLLEVERRPLRSKLKRALSDAKSHIVSDVIIGVVLMIALAGGYELYSWMSGGAGMTGRDSAEVASVRFAAQGGAAERDKPATPQMPIALPVETPVAPGGAASARQTIDVARGDNGSDQSDEVQRNRPADASAPQTPIENPAASDPASPGQMIVVAQGDGGSGQSGAVQRDKPADASAPQTPIAPSIEHPVAPGGVASPGHTVEVARGDGSDLPVGQTGAKPAPDDSRKTRADEPQDRHDAQSVDVQVPSAETHNGAPGPSSSGVAPAEIKPGGMTAETVGASAGTAKQPADTRASARLHAAAKRPLGSRAPLRHAWLVHRARMDSQYCEPNAPHVLGSGY
jgi:curved DNA-binding protein CbpA